MDLTPEQFEEQYIAQFKVIMDSAVKNYALIRRTIEKAQEAPAVNIHE